MPLYSSAPVPLPQPRHLPDWTPEDYEKICSRIQQVFEDVGVTFNGQIPRIAVKNERVTSGLDCRQRCAAESLLFERYKQDGLLLLPHQKDPSNARPPWFQDSMLVPGPHSIGQKLFTVSFRRMKDRVTGRRLTQAQRITQFEQQGQQPDNVHHRTSSPVANIEPESTQDNLRPKRLEDLTIYINIIVELDHGRLAMHATLRDPQSWFDDSVAGTFDFEKVRRSVGVPARCEKELSSSQP